MSKKLDEYLKREENNALLRSQLEKVFSSFDFSSLKGPTVPEEQIPYEFSKAHQQILSQALEDERNGKYKEAFELFKELSDHNSRIGYEKVGEYYLKGIGTIKDENRAFTNFLQSKKLGSIKGHFFVGYCKFNGIGTLKDQYNGLIDIENAAFLDSIEAMEFLVDIFERGEYVEVDYDAANFWREKLGEDVASA